MVRIAKRTDPEKLRELKRKINDERYIAAAIDRIALDLTRSLVQKAQR